MFILFLSTLALAQSTSSSNVGSVSGRGTARFVPLWEGPATLGNSDIFESETKRVGIGTRKPEATLDVKPASLVLAISARGGNAAAGSNNNGADGLHSIGGNGDGDGQFGGDGLHGTGGMGSGGGNGVVGRGGSGFLGDGIGVVGIGGGTTGDAIFGLPVNGCSSCLAGNFAGNVVVNGTLTATTKNFRIDHPLDPANKFLVHASVESSEMKNFYDGTVRLDKKGEAVVQLPDWFEAANGSLRYQLTAIGAPSPGLYIAQKVAGNHFKIAGGAPGVEVSWQITGVRQDKFAQANPLVVEQPKNAKERGYFIHPELYGVPGDQGMEWARHPQFMRQLREAETAQAAAAAVPRWASSQPSHPPQERATQSEGQGFKPSNTQQK